MVFNLLCNGDFTTPEQLVKRLKWCLPATITVLGNKLRDLGYESEVREVRYRTNSDEDTRNALIDLYAQAHFLPDFEDRRQDVERRRQVRLANRDAAVQMDALTEKKDRAAQILSELPPQNHSQEVKEYLDKSPWECAICFERRTDPQELVVTCWGKRAEREASAQHAACTKCSEPLERCHMCRRPAEHLQLTRAWLGNGLAMHMGVNPFLVRR